MGKQAGMTLLPCKKNVCQECAVDHPKDHPHNADSLYYQYKFLDQHGRWPTWEDAIAHCNEEVKAVVRKTISDVKAK
jgi:hypothetical protein